VRRNKAGTPESPELRVAVGGFPFSEKVIGYLPDTSEVPKWLSITIRIKVGEFDTW
jgi:hypothetical protein